MRDAVLNEGMGDIFSDREEKEKKRLTVTRHRSSHDRMLNAHHCFYARHNIQLMIKDSFINLLDRVCITFYVPKVAPLHCTTWGWLYARISPRSP